MKHIISTISTLSMVLLVGALFIMQAFPGRKLLKRSNPSCASPSFYPTSSLEESSVSLENGEISPQAQEILFSHLKVKEVERRAKGNVKEEDAIQAQERVFTDSESWRAFWSPYGDGEVPRVDFKTRHVAAVFLGAKPNPGYGVEISKIIYNPRKKLTVIRAVELLPDPEMSYLAVLVYPADIVVFPAKPGKVHFKRIQRVRTEQP